MLMNVQAPVRRYVVTLYGPSGTGKTTMATTAPKPVVLLLEPQGWESIRDAAKGKAPVPTFSITNVEELREAVRILLTSKEPLVDLVKAHTSDPEVLKAALESLPYATPETVVIDSATEALKKVVDGIEHEAKPRIGKDGLPVRSESAWGAIGDRGERLLRAFRDLTTRGFHVLLLAQLDDSEKGKDDEKRRVCAPAAPMQKLQRAFSYVSNAVGITQRERRMVARRDKNGGELPPEEQIVWSVRFTGPDWMMLKLVHGLRPIETQNFSAWIKRIDKHDKTTASAATAETSNEPTNTNESHGDDNQES